MVFTSSLPGWDSSNKTFTIWAKWDLNKHDNLTSTQVRLGRLRLMGKKHVRSIGPSCINGESGCRRADSLASGDVMLVKVSLCPLVKTSTCLYSKRLHSCPTFRHDLVHTRSLHSEVSHQPLLCIEYTADTIPIESLFVKRAGMLVAEGSDRM